MKCGIFTFRASLFVLLSVLAISCSEEEPILVNVTFSAERDYTDHRQFDGLSFDINDFRICIHKKGDKALDDGYRTMNEVVLDMPYSHLPKPIKLPPGEYSANLISNKVELQGSGLYDFYYYVHGYENFTIRGDEKDIHLTIILNVRLTGNIQY